ncbi:MAG TPA: folylpolyglutamate synthase/dihydrofolate synthase family protein [Myxococcota bacterium]
MDALTRLLASPTRPKLGLARMQELLERLDHPERRILANGGRVLHVAGTKGKGSTCAFAESLCRRAGLRTGLTTSPHLCCARERIAIDGAMIDEAAFVLLEDRVHLACAELDCSFFERMIAMALCAFVDARVDVAIVEVGLGGRLDATNTVVPTACAITRLGLDHIEWLGPTLAHIAREKAGILKSNMPAVSAPQKPEARAVLEQVARDVGAPLAFVDVEGPLSARKHPELSLVGAHQRENAALALSLVEAAGIAVDDKTARSALASTMWPGRYEVIGGSTAPIILDGAHNEDAALALGETLAADPVCAHGIVLVVGMTAGHDADAFARALLDHVDVDQPLAIFPTFSSPRAQPPSAVAAAFARAFAERGRAPPLLSTDQGVAGVCASLQTGVIPAVVTGSLYLVGEVRHHLLGVPMDPAMPLF